MSKLGDSRPPFGVSKKTWKVLIDEASADDLRALSLEKVALILNKSKLTAMICYNAGRALGLQSRELPDELIEPESYILNNRVMTREDLYIKAVGCDDTFSRAYTALGMICDDEIVLGNSEKMTKRQLFLKAIQLDPMSNSSARAYDWLAYLLPAGGVATLLNGKVMTKRQLYLKAMDIDPNYSKPFNELPTTMAAGESVSLLNGAQMTKRQLFIKAIALNPSYAWAYTELGTDVGDGFGFLSNGSNMTQRQLLLKGIECDASYASAYYRLGNSLSNGESVVLPNKTTVWKQDLYLEAISLNPNIYISETEED